MARVCCLFLAAFGLGPRIALLLWWLFGDRVDAAFDSWLWPLLGLLFLPWTTLAYAGMWGASSNEVTGFEWLVSKAPRVLRPGDRAARAQRLRWALTRASIAVASTRRVGCGDSDGVSGAVVNTLEAG